MSINAAGARVGWFADISAGEPTLWQPVIETTNGCHAIDTWFKTEAECQQFIHDHLTDQACVDTCHPAHAPRCLYPAPDHVGPWYRRCDLPQGHDGAHNENDEYDIRETP